MDARITHSYQDLWFFPRSLVKQAEGEAVGTLKHFMTAPKWPYSLLKSLSPVCEDLKTKIGPSRERRADLPCLKATLSVVEFDDLLLFKEGGEVFPFRIGGDGSSHAGHIWLDVDRHSGAFVRVSSSDSLAGISVSD